MKVLKILIFLLICFFLFGCAKESKNQVKTMFSVCEAVYTNQPVKLDGKLNDQIWRQAPSYPMFLSRNQIDKCRILQEKGQVKFAWDENYFYVAAEFEDSDLVAQGSEDEKHHYRYGDVCELFLKPKDQSYYWELYVTPAGKKSSM